VQQGHYVFINLGTSKIYCMPNNYEVKDRSLEEIQQYLSPHFREEDILRLDAASATASASTGTSKLPVDVNGRTFRPGFVGLNNLGGTDHINAVMQALGHVPAFRDFFLRSSSDSVGGGGGGVPSTQRAFVEAVGECIRRLWSPVNFKGVISPQRLVKSLGHASGGKFAPGSASNRDPIDFLRFLLSYMHTAFLNPAFGLGDEASQKVRSSVVSECFQGVVEVVEEKKETDGGGGGGVSSSGSGGGGSGKVTVSRRRMPFNYLSLDIPPTPLFRESEGGRVVPTLPISQLLEKFNGVKATEQYTPAEGVHIKRTFRLVSLPRHLIINCARKETQSFSNSKHGRNCTVITFPVTNLELCSVCGVHEDSFSCPASLDLCAMGAEELQTVVERYGSLVPGSQASSSSSRETTKQETPLKLAVQAIAAACKVSRYNLVANVCQNSSAAASVESDVDVANSTVGGAGAMSNSKKKKKNRERAAELMLLSNKSKVHIHHHTSSGSGSGQQWYEVEDLEVKEVEPQAIGVCETDILIYQLQE
jgi:U4/U6.U5 tri-snRNP-associated protein 2